MGKEQEARNGERWAIARYLKEVAKGHRKHACALLADAGTQARVEATGYDRLASEMERVALDIEDGRHWR